jgi:ADP-ribosylglycohydrolase
MNGSEMNSGREPELASAWMRRLRVGEPRTLGGLSVFPLSWEVPGVFPYLTLGEALEKRTVVITEASQGGSVPELAVENTGDTAVLLLDGEELRGAKQNRVLNTSILLAPKSRSMIPVSCTEQGRWHYVSNTFEDSGVVMSRSARIGKNVSVSMSLKEGRAHRSDQGAVWDSIRDLSDRAGVFSSTGAQRDVFESRKAALVEAERDIPCMEGQCGLLVFAQGKPVGFDAVSLPSAYARLHGKLLKSYALESLLAEEKPEGKAPGTEEAHAFLQACADLAGEAYPAIGLGVECRFESRGKTGFSLVHHGEAIHSAFFALPEAKPGRGREDDRTTLASVGIRRNLRAGPRSGRFSPERLTPPECLEECVFLEPEPRRDPPARPLLYGAVSGDIVGSVFERRPIKTTDFPLFSPASRWTDDTVLTIATAEVLLTGGDFEEAYRRWGRRYPDAGYGRGFRHWLTARHPEPYQSYGNGSAMRVAPVGWVCGSLDETLELARHSAAPTHDHPEGIKGAQAVAGAVYLARSGASKEEIRSQVESRFGYGLGRTLAEIRPVYAFDPTCQGSVPEALIAFLESTGFEDALRKAVSLGGDSDTQACIAGAVAEAFYGGVPFELEERVRALLPGEMTRILDRFGDHYGNQGSLRNRP